MDTETNTNPVPAPSLFRGPPVPAPEVNAWPYKAARCPDDGALEIWDGMWRLFALPADFPEAHVAAAVAAFREGNRRGERWGLLMGRFDAQLARNNAI